MNTPTRNELARRVEQLDARLARPARSFVVRSTERWTPRWHRWNELGKVRMPKQWNSEQIQGLKDQAREKFDSLTSRFDLSDDENRERLETAFKGFKASMKDAEGHLRDALRRPK